MGPEPCHNLYLSTRNQGNGAGTLSQSLPFNEKPGKWGRNLVTIFTFQRETREMGPEPCHNLYLSTRNQGNGAGTLSQSLPFNEKPGKWGRNLVTIFTFQRETREMGPEPCHNLYLSMRNQGNGAGTLSQSLPFNEKPGKWGRNLVTIFTFQRETREMGPEPCHNLYLSMRNQGNGGGTLAVLKMFDFNLKQQQQQQRQQHYIFVYM
ncbi:hypothetical protein BgiBS90_007617 [Biomphalaria glabrata]|nr:hypothetical protein BgiBS90_007617 [Biomphalaria glabrata]